MIPLTEVKSRSGQNLEFLSRLHPDGHFAQVYEQLVGGKMFSFDNSLKGNVLMLRQDIAERLNKLSYVYDWLRHGAGTLPDNYLGTHFRV